MYFYFGIEVMKNFSMMIVVNYIKMIVNLDKKISQNKSFLQMFFYQNQFLDK